MTFKIFAVELKDFKCFYGEHIFELPEHGGLFYLTGRNLYNKRLGANAVGKTSLIDAIEWCVYGKTSRGLRAGDVVAWGKKSCSVAVSLLVGDDEIEISRFQNPNKIKINGRDSSQEEVTKHIRLTQEAFNCSVILPQFGSSFFDLSPTQKLSLFSQVMHLDYWMDKSDRAKEEAGVILTKITTLDINLSKLEGKLESNREDIKSLKDKDAKFQELKKAKRKKLIAEREKYIGAAKPFEKKIKKFNKEIVEIDEAIIETDDLIKGMEEQISKVNHSINECENTKSWLRRDIVKLQAEIKDLETLENDVCPTCRQVVDEKHVGKHVKKLTGKIDEYMRDIKTLDKHLAKDRKSHGEFKGILQSFLDIKRDAKSQKETLLSEIRRLERKINDIELDIKYYDKELSNLDNEENPYTGMLKERKEAIRDLKVAIADLQDELDATKEKHEAISYWINGFKRIRLFVVEEALTALEIEINNLLVTLGMTDWKITLDIERENKSGGVTKGFSVFIHSPRHNEPVRWESWSGGETQRLRLAGDLGLANLIMEQAGFDNKVEIIDEPSEHMSPEGIEDMIETLYQRAMTTGKQIWLVDHSTMDFGGFAGVLVSVMDQNGKASLEYVDRS